MAIHPEREDGSMRLNSRGLITALAVAFGLAACSDVPSGPTATPTEAPARQAKGGAAIPDRYVVVFKNDVRDAPGLARQLANAHGGTVHHTYQHAIKGFAATLPAAAASALRNNPNVAYVEQDQRVHLVQTTQPNATWGIDRVDQRDLPLSGTYTYSSTGAGVTAYIIDTGIETSHWEFGGRASVGADYVGDGYNGQDCNGHGTHVAGTVGGANYGVAKSASLVSVRVLDCGSNGTWSGVIAGIDWVRYYRTLPAVANLSLGGGAMQSVDDAIQNLFNSGVTVVVAAGNGYGDDACSYSPARAPAALTVGNSTRYDQQSASSSTGSCLDLFAPGEEITSAWLSGGTNTISGTSMASPHVAGAAALYLQGDPSASPATVGNWIISNATPNRLMSLGAGAPNLLLYTLGGTVTPPPPPPGLSAYISGPSTHLGSGNYTWRANAAGGDGTYTYQWQHRAASSTSWTDVGTNSPTYTRYLPRHASPFYLRVIVTSGGASVTSPDFYVK